MDIHNPKQGFTLKPITKPITLETNCYFVKKKNMKTQQYRFKLDLSFIG